MKITNFFTTLNYAIGDINNNSNKMEDDNSFESNFDSIMQRYASYIQSVVEERFDGDVSEITEEELNMLLMEDFYDIIDQTYANTNIYLYSMKYIASKYLDKHRDRIPELLAKIKERGMTYTEGEMFTDDFEENLLITLLSLEDDYKTYYESMKESNQEYFDEILEYKEKYGKDDGFKRFCDKYLNMRHINISTRRLFVSYAYLLVYGIEGIDENTCNKNSPALKYKKKFSVKDYTKLYADRVEESYREELKLSIISLVSQLDRLGEITDATEKHNKNMDKINLPGLKYYVEDDEQKKDDSNSPEFNLPKVDSLLTSDQLDKLDIDTLLRMNSFYNNRFARIIKEYAKTLFFLDNTTSTYEVLRGNTLSKKSLDSTVFSNLLIKYEALTILMNSFYTSSQNDVEKNPDNYSKRVQEIKLDEEDDGGKAKKQQVVLELDDFVRDVIRVWRKDYEKYFDEKLPGIDNKLKTDLKFANTLYNPIFLTYRFKNMALKSEYAYMWYLSKEENRQDLNFGVAVGKGVRNNTSVVQLASDGENNLPNRLHIKRREFVDFLKSYTGGTLARIYEGYQDFFVGGQYISTQLLLPVAEEHKKYIRDLKRQKKVKGDEVSAISPKNKNFVSHIEYCADRSNFMPEHKIERIKFDKKGTPVKTMVKPERYMDIITGNMYIRNEEGNIVDKKGQIYGESGERLINE